jgi:hypothetical protein
LPTNKQVLVGLLQKKTLFSPDPKNAVLVGLLAQKSAVLVGLFTKKTQFWSCQKKRFWSDSCEKIPQFWSGSLPKKAAVLWVLVQLLPKKSHGFGRAKKNAFLVFSAFFFAPPPPFFFPSSFSPSTSSPRFPSSSFSPFLFCPLLYKIEVNIQFRFLPGFGRDFCTTKAQFWSGQKERGSGRLLAPKKTVGLLANKKTQFRSCKKSYSLGRARAKKPGSWPSPSKKEPRLRSPQKTLFFFKASKPEKKDLANLQSCSNLLMTLKCSGT